MWRIAYIGRTFKRMQAYRGLKILYIWENVFYDCGRN
jgi:hypothetical protein